MLSRLRFILIKLTKNKRLNVFSLFLLLAFLILVLSKLSKLYTETLAVEVNIVNLPKDKVLAITNTPKLDIVVNTYGFYLLGSYFHNNTIEIDLEKNAYQHNNTFNWVANRALPDIEKQLGKRFEIVSIQPDTLSLSFGILSTKKVPVRLNSNVTYASGYDTLKGMILKPDSVEVIGSDTEIKHVNYIETSELNLQNIKKDINATVGLKLPETGNTVKLSENEVSVTANVQKFTEGTLEIPVIINNLPSEIQINYFPKTIKVSYEVSLNDYKSIKPSAFKIECDYLEIKNSNKSYFTPKLIKQPERIKRVKMKQDKIEYIITE